MNVLEPSEPEFDPSLEDLFDSIDADDVLCVPALSSEDLLNRFHEADAELRRLGEIRYPKTQAGRDVHSLRSSLVVELRRRNLL